jgi:gliding motility-associated-like protein
MFYFWEIHGYRIIRWILSSFLFFIALPSYSQIALDTWLVGQYDFNNNSLDHTQYQNNLIGSNEAFGPDRFCTPNAAIHLNGTQNLVQTQTNGLNNKQYTFTFWLKTEAVNSNYATLVDIGSDPGKNNGQRVILTNSGNIVASSGTTNNPGNALVSLPTNIPAGNWVFVAVVRSLSNFAVYIDGNEVYHLVLQAYPSTYYNAINPALYIGSDPDQSHFYMGFIDDFHIYNEDLTAETIKAIYGFGTEKQIGISPDNLCVNKPVTFRLDSTNAIGVVWNFGDPNATQAENYGNTYTVQHTYSQPGNYVVTGLLSTACSVHAPVSTVAMVGACKPPCNLPTFITANDSCLENSISFDAHADPSVQSIIWDFGDQTSKTVVNKFPFQANHKYALPGTYNISAQVSDTCHEGVALYLQGLNVNSCLPQPIPQIPNAFSPNGDGINDTWAIPSLLYYPKCQVKVLDRWGNLVFSTSQGYSQVFDGYRNGVRLPMGAYYYIIQLKDGIKPLAGSVSILY